MDGQLPQGRATMAESCIVASTAPSTNRRPWPPLLPLLLLLSSVGLCAALSPEVGDEDAASKLPLSFEYHNYTTMTAFLKDVARKYPNLTSLESIGNSVKGRNLWTLMVSSQQDDATLPLGTPNIKFIGNIHGNEAVGRELIFHLIKYLVTKYKVNNTVTQLLDTTRIYFLPSMNPDGFEVATELACSAGQGRKNMRNVDLNRSFPDKFTKNKNQIQPETKAVIKWMERVPFILSASLHGGALVANYPYENHPETVPAGTFPPSLTPDDDVFKHLALTYAQAHPTMHKGVNCQDKAANFKNGITNGAAWYIVIGGMQDYNYVWHGCMEITLEISCCKYPPHRDLNQLWNDNREALLIYAWEAHKGVKGIVTDAFDGRPIAGAKIKIRDRNMTFNSSSRGEFWRLLLPRRNPYRIEVHANGYQRQVITFQVLANEGSIKWLDIAMKREETEVEEIIVGTQETSRISEEIIHRHTTPAINSTELIVGGSALNKSSPHDHLSENELDNEDMTDLHNIRTQKSVQDVMVSAGWMHSAMVDANLSAILFLLFVC